MDWGNWVIVVTCRALWSTQRSCVAVATATATATATPTYTPAQTPRLGKVYLPSVLRDFVLERYEPNDSLERAWGPLVSGGLYEAWLRHIPAGADYDLYLYDDLSALLAYNPGQGANDESLVTAALPPGRYYLRVRRVSAENAFGPYTFGAAYR